MAKGKGSESCAIVVWPAGSPCGGSELAPDIQGGEGRRALEAARQQLTGALDPPRKSLSTYWKRGGAGGNGARGLGTGSEQSASAGSGARRANSSFVGDSRPAGPTRGKETGTRHRSTQPSTSDDVPPPARGALRRRGRRRAPTAGQCVGSAQPAGGRRSGEHLRRGHLRRRPRRARRQDRRHGRACPLPRATACEPSPSAKPARLETIVASLTRDIGRAQLLELLAWFGSTSGGHFSNIDASNDMVDVNDVRPLPALAEQFAPLALPGLAPHSRPFSRGARAAAAAVPAVGLRRHRL